LGLFFKAKPKKYDDRYINYSITQKTHDFHLAIQIVTVQNKRTAVACGTGRVLCDKMERSN